MREAMLTVPILAVALTSAAAAQAPHPRPSPGDVIRVTTEASPRMFRFRGVRGDTLVAEREGTTFSIPMDRIEALAVRSPRPWSERGLLVLGGGAVGLAAGGLLGLAGGSFAVNDCQDASCELGVLDYALRGALIGLGAGAVVGVIVASTKRWTAVPANTLLMSPVPSGARLEMKVVLRL